jgi:hypothetical protein
MFLAATPFDPDNPFGPLTPGELLLMKTKLYQLPPAKIRDHAQRRYLKVRHIEAKNLTAADQANIDAWVTAIIARQWNGQQFDQAIRGNPVPSAGLVTTADGNKVRPPPAPPVTATPGVPPAATVPAVMVPLPNTPSTGPVAQMRLPVAPVTGSVDYMDLVRQAAGAVGTALQPASATQQTAASDVSPTLKYAGIGLLALLLLR